MLVSEIIALYEKLSPENQMQVRAFVQQLVAARRVEEQEEHPSPCGTFTRPIEKSET